MKYPFACLFFPLLLAGCANQNSIYRTFSLANGDSPMIDIRQRAILVAPATTKRDLTVCAESSPDAMAALAYELAASTSVSNKGSLDFGMGMHDSAAFTGLRTQSIQLLRDFGYRLCESYLSGAISAPQYDLLMRRFQKNTVALLAIEQLTGTIKVAPVSLAPGGDAATGKALAEQRLEREKIVDQLSALATQKAALEKELADAKKTAGADTAEIDKKIADLQATQAALQTDLKAKDQAIANARDALGGKLQLVSQPHELSPPSDMQLASVAAVVRDIVNNIVLSDDENQICYDVLQRNDGKQSELREICATNLATHAQLKAVQARQLQIEQSILLHKLSSASAGPADTGIDTALRALSYKVDDRLRAGNSTYSVPFDFSNLRRVESSSAGKDNDETPEKKPVTPPQ